MLGKTGQLMLIGSALWTADADKIFVQKFLEENLTELIMD